MDVPSQYSGVHRAGAIKLTEWEETSVPNDGVDDAEFETAAQTVLFQWGKMLATRTAYKTREYIHTQGERGAERDSLTPQSITPIPYGRMDIVPQTHLPVTHGDARSRYRAAGIAARSGKERDAELLPCLDPTHGDADGEGMSVRLRLEGVSLLRAIVHFDGRGLEYCT